MRTTSMEGFAMLAFLSSFLSIQFCSAVDTITTTRFMKDGETIVSSGGSFEMGLFSPGNSPNRYLGIWYKEDVQALTVVWVANRERPLTITSGVLQVIEPGILALQNGTNDIIWSSSMPRPAQNPVAQLLDSGNLVVREASDDNPENFLWQSFDYPSDTLLPGMKLGKDFKTGLERYLTSWKSEDDPAPGDYTFHCDPSGYPQNILKRDSVKLFRSGSWNGIRFSGMPYLKPNPIYTYRLVFNEEEVYYSYDLHNSSVASVFTLNQYGVTQLRVWNPTTKGWLIYESTPVDNCDNYALCGPYSFCNIGNSPLCLCLDEFEPKYPSVWSVGDWSNGCVRKIPLSCSNGEGFRKYSAIKLPDTKTSWFDGTMTLNECEKVCMKNCSCTAYANLDIRGGGSGCLLWFGDLIDIKMFPEGAQEVYVRIASSELGSTIIVSTSALSKKLGMLEEGREIAVKRLSKTSKQGIKEFKNEVTCIAKLQHRNLVKLLGFCVQGEEKMLIYEYMPNKSLDFFIFDETSRTILDWPRRFRIIDGIARGLLYLHQDSRLRIIHRDLKASNVLLDSDMNPKISDFGLARSFGGNETGANTNRVVGTYGYMSPEYAIDGLFSVNSDVFSFGVLVLEIVSGKKNRCFIHPDHHHNLLGHAWRLHKEDRSMELIDPHIHDSCLVSEVLRSIHVGLLCVQQCPKERPSMSSVVLMLASDSALPQPKHPGFFTERNIESQSSPGMLAPGSIRAQSEHQNAELHLAEGPISVKIALLQHAQQVIVGQVLQAQQGRVVLEAVKVIAAPSLDLRECWWCLVVGLVSGSCSGDGDERLVTATTTMASGGGGDGGGDADGTKKRQQTLKGRMRTWREGFAILFFSSSLVFIQIISNAEDTITATQLIKDGDTIVSAGGSFEMGFFSPGSSTNRYVGIWYKKISVRTVVWVANRNIPMTNASGILKINNLGNLVLVNAMNEVVWSSNTSRTARNPIAQLLESGNLVVRNSDDDKPENFLWQSFDYPTDTQLPGMKLGKDFVTGLERYLSSWKSNDDPAPGDYTYHLDPSGYPQIILVKGSDEVYRTGPWNGVVFSGRPSFRGNTIYTHKVVFNKQEVYYTFELRNSSVLSRFALNQSGVAQRWTWVDKTDGWSLYLTAPTDNCDTYKLCGAYGSCNIGNSPVCKCLDKFVPISSDDWASTDWSKGCVRKAPLNCRNGDGFLKYSHLKLPDTWQSRFNVSINLKECEILCLKNCSCTAYANLDIAEGGSGCLLWFDDLIDIREFSEGGQDLYVRMASSEEQGQEIAVKRLSKTSRQGLDEFMTEVVCIAKLQHRNLVKLLGYCIEGEEKMLIYEYMPNKSLNSFIFVEVKALPLEEDELTKKKFWADETQGKLLDWPQRFHIIMGLARGLLYLHEDSRLRIIHRDFKASNVLLDSEMNPKISDFGMARSFGEYETRANTTRVVGTYGYMSPEYAVDGIFSVKSDVFSFGVLVLEIVSGKRNRGFVHPDHDHNLLGHAWILCKEGRSLELIDATLVESCNQSEVQKSIHVGLLCVQQCPEDRPSMSSVIMMLGSEGALPQPKQPGFFTERTIVQQEFSSSYAPSSTNEMTITLSR
ncbi:hypothetical protein RJ640_004588 [Escallonia rubra]|uniref:non-specific serine/threonine protein kinase n=1 Tax=Escallonia rubra TaxID=112253 RepID=A0AA88UKD2_9ASTE|nr:hypothetical protein RJ640_004588 [Escallonia rubra]